MTLYEAQKGGSYCVEGLCVEPAITRRLQALGLNDGTIVNILNRKKHGALIVQVRGTRLALGKHISSSIQVSESSGEEAGPEDGKGLADGMGLHGICTVEDRILAEKTAAEGKVSAEGGDAAAPDRAEEEAPQKEGKSRES